MTSVKEYFNDFNANAITNFSHEEEGIMKQMRVRLFHTNMRLN